MKIVVDYNDSEVDNLKVESAKYLGDFVIEINFNDGAESIVDFKPFLAWSNHPSNRKYLDESNFTQYRLIEGNLNWNDYDMIFPIEDLYGGKI